MVKLKHGWADRGGNRKAHFYRNGVAGRNRISICGIDRIPSDQSVIYPYPDPADNFRCSLCLRALKSAIPNKLSKPGSTRQPYFT